MTTQEVDPEESTVWPATGPRLVTPTDRRGKARQAVQDMVGFKAQSDPAYDKFAQRICETTGASFGGVNHVGLELAQFFTGMAAHGMGENAEAIPDANRTMPADHGLCVYVIERERAMAINDLREYARFASNPVIEKLGVTRYIGAPLQIPDGVIGTVWGILATEPGIEIDYTRDELARARAVPKWTQDDVDVMKAVAIETTEYVMWQARQQ